MGLILECSRAHTGLSNTTGYGKDRPCQMTCEAVVAFCENTDITETSTKQLSGQLVNLISQSTHSST